MNDQELTFYYYNDGLTRGERQQVANVLVTDADVARRYQEICRELDLLAKPGVLAAPTDMVERWRDSLDRAVHTETIATRKPPQHRWTFFWSVAVTAALAIGIGIGVLISTDDAPPANDAVALTVHTGNPDAFLRGLQVHLRESERGLSSTPLSSSADRTTLLVNIIEQNRRYERVAEQNNSQNLARVLRSFELVLLRLAADDVTPQEAEALQAKLLFELNVVLTKLSRDPSDEPLSI